MAMAMATHDYVSVHTVVGESGQPLTVIQKNPTDLPTGARRAAPTTRRCSRWRRSRGSRARRARATASARSSDARRVGRRNTRTRPTFTSCDRLQQDLPPLTGQTTNIPMLVSQQNSVAGRRRDRRRVGAAVQKAGVDHPGEIVCTGPKYQYPYATDNTHVHLPAHDTNAGRKIRSRSSSSASCSENHLAAAAADPVERSGSVVTVHFHVPVPPLAWDDDADGAAPDRPTPNGRRAADSRLARPARASRSAASRSPATACRSPRASRPVGAAGGGRLRLDRRRRHAPAAQPARWGQLRDSDPFVGLLHAEARSRTTASRSS